MSAKSVPQTKESIEVYIGKKLHERRQALKLTQQDVASQVFITAQQIHKYEKGLDRIPASRLYKLANVLSVPLSFFYEGWEDS